MGIETGMFNEMVSFAKNVKHYVEKVIMTIVSVDEVDIAKARKTVEEKIGAEFRARPFI